MFSNIIDYLILDHFSYKQFSVTVPWKTKPKCIPNRHYGTLKKHYCESSLKGCRQKMWRLAIYTDDHGVIMKFKLAMVFRFVPQLKLLRVSWIEISKSTRKRPNDNFLRNFVYNISETNLTKLNTESLVKWIFYYSVCHDKVILKVNLCIAFFYFCQPRPLLFCSCGCFSFRLNLNTPARVVIGKYTPCVLSEFVSLAFENVSAAVTTANEINRSRPDKCQTEEEQGCLSSMMGRKIHL